MIHRSQKDLRYKDLKLGTCTKTIGQVGCFMCDLSMFAYEDPVIVNEKLKNNGGYANGCSMLSEKAAEILKLKYDGVSKVKPPFICIAETDYYKPVWKGGVPQHFFVFLPLGSGDFMIDPLDPPETIGLKPVKYPIVSYRLFHERTYTPTIPEVWNGERPDDYAKRSEVDLMLSRYRELYNQ